MYTTGDYAYGYDNTTDYQYLYDYTDEPCTTASPLPPAFQSVLFSMVFALGLMGNAAVLWVLLKSIRLKSMTDVCLLNLSLSDLLVTSSLPLWAYQAQGHSITSHAVCQVMAGMYRVGFYSGILFVTVMSVDRHLAIVHAVAALGARTLRFGALVSATVWTVSVCAALPEAIFASAIKGENNTTCQSHYPQGSAKTWKLLLNICENAVGLFISLPVMIYCYVRILVVVRRTRNSKRDRAMKLIFTIVGMFVVFWVPYNVVIFLMTLQEFGIGNTCKVSKHLVLAMEVTQTIALTHCCVNPVIYAFVGEKFRKSLTNVLSKYPFCAKLGQATAIHSKVSENETSNTPL